MRYFNTSGPFSKVDGRQATIEVRHNSLTLNSFELKGKGIKKLENFSLKEGKRQTVTLERCNVITFKRYNVITFERHKRFV